MGLKWSKWQTKYLLTAYNLFVSLYILQMYAINMIILKSEIQKGL